MAKKKNQVDELLEKSASFRTNVAMIVFDYEKEFFIKFLDEITEDIENGKILQISQDNKSIVILVEDAYADEFKKRYKDRIKVFKKDLAAIVVMFPKKVIKIPGVLSKILNKFSKNKINLVQLITCYSNTTFLIERRNLFKAMDALGMFGK